MAARVMAAHSYDESQQVPDAERLLLCLIFSAMNIPDTLMHHVAQAMGQVLPQ